MFRIRNRMPKASKSIKLYVSGSTEASPSSSAAGNILSRITISAKERWQKASSLTARDLVMLYIEPTRRFGGQMPETWFGGVFSSTGLAIPAFTGFDYDTTNQMLGEHVGIELTDGMEVTVDNKSFNSSASYTMGGDIFVDTANPGKVTQVDSPSSGNERLGYVTVLPSVDYGLLTWRVARDQVA